MIDSKRALQTAIRYVGSRVQRRLFFAFVAPLRRCNLACSYCYQADMQNGEMGLDDFRRYLHRLKSMGVGVVSFTGGEAMLWPHLEMAVSEVRSLGLISHLVTNGTLLDSARVDGLAAAGLDGMLVSIDSLSRIPGIPKSIDARPGLLGALARARSAGVSVTSNAVLSPETAGEIPVLMERLGDQRIPISIGFCDSDPHDRDSGRTFEVPRDGELLDDVVGKILWAISRGTRVVEPAEYFASYRGHLQGRTGWSCIKPQLRSLTVAPDGKLLLCSRLPLVVGDLNSTGAPLYEDAERLARSQVEQCSGQCYSNCSYNSAFYQSHPMYGLRRALSGLPWL